MMATERYFVCASCKQERWVSRLFDALREHAHASAPQCECGGQQWLRLIFNWGLEAGPFNCRVVASFLPKIETKWDHSTGNIVKFYPFLIITEGIDNKNRAVWLPYWHTVTSEGGRIKTKYGQWAPQMDIDTFSELIQQAQLKGFFMIALSAFGGMKILKL